MSEHIEIKNARVHNLKNVSLSIPKHKLTVITGLSGSGKSSLAFDTIYAEGQRRYAESLNSYARQFMGVQDKPDVDEIKGLSPTIAIDQKNIARNPRSTVGTMTEIYDYLRLLFARIGVQYCPETHTPVIQHTPGEITEIIRKQARNSEELYICAPIITGSDVQPKKLLDSLKSSHVKTIRVNGLIMKVDEIAPKFFSKDKKYDIDVVVAKIHDTKRQDVHDIVERALELSNGRVMVINEDTGEEEMLTIFPYCAASDKTFEPIEPRSFSFNSPVGACPDCTGLGYTLAVDASLIIPNPRLSIAEGAIQPWTRIVGNQKFYQKLIELVAKKNSFSVDIPVQDLSEKNLDIIFYGTGKTEYTIEGKKTIFEGVVPNLSERYHDSKSDYIRNEIKQYMKTSVCESCQGRRLKQHALHVLIGEYSIADIVEMNIEEAHTLFKKGIIDVKKLSAGEKQIIETLTKEIRARLENLLTIGLYYLTLDRSITTLSGGEAQRIRLSTQLSTGLNEVIYILDEPSIGLHAKDNDKLINTLNELKQNNNTVVVVEHDKTVIEAAEYLIDVGPGAGIYGGEIMGSGTLAEMKKMGTLTAQYLTKQKEIALPKKRRNGNGKKITIHNAKAFNLKDVTVDIPLGTFTCITGVSGSGKSTLVHGILSKALSKHFYRAKTNPGEHKKITGLSNIDKVISIDQEPIGRTPRSNPATYTGVFTLIRDLFAGTQEAKMRGYDPGMFSFNVKGGGRCEACSGDGSVRIPMQFLSDVFVECSSCAGRRYNQEALEVHYRRKSIADVLEMTVEEAHSFFAHIAPIADKLQILREVGLGYLHLGQSATTLSGGEAQRIKLATELSRRATGKTLYILDEPTTGLHFDDIKKLLHVLNELVERGNTILMIEHNLDVVKCADWIIDMGPDGGKNGGEVVAFGVPEDVVKSKRSYTGKYLKELL